MNEKRTSGSFELRPIKNLKEFNFLVDDYQRGYKWTSQQALDLLDDINEFSIQDGIYCLQPLVIKKQQQESNTVYELIDGQQRMTTIYMILSSINRADPFYTIDYRTRGGSGIFLNNIKGLEIIDLDIALLDNISKLEDEINFYWEIFIKNNENQGYNNVDNYHFYLVYQTIQLWFKNKDLKAITNFQTKLLCHTNVIWYQINPDEISERVFKNINSGKIALTNAELIKALFLNNCKDDSNKELTNFRQNEIALEWDRIEYALQNNEFWYFINDDSENNEKATRIDFLFDILKGKNRKEKDQYYSYRKYDKDVKKGGQLNWQEVKDLFERLQEWFENRTLYHLVGFIISQNFKTISELITLSKGKGKGKLEEEMRDIIRKRFKAQKDNKYLLDNLDYKESPNETLAILLLFNIETYQTSDSNFKFPFDRFKKEKWSIEHIHAQNPKTFTLNKEVIEWAKDILGLIEDLEKSEKSEKEKLKQLKDGLHNLRLLSINENLTNDDKSKILELSEEVKRYLNTDKISNLALLDGITNSTIGNKNFLNKREVILNIDKRGWTELNGAKRKAFIPICTKNVFLKYYTAQNKEVQMAYWGYQDRKDYYNSINSTLEKYYN